MTHAYTPTSFSEFPNDASQGLSDLSGTYLEEDILYFSRCPGSDDYALHLVKKLDLDQGHILADIIQPYSSEPHMGLAGQYSYQFDSLNGNVNIKVHGVCRFTVRSGATLYPLSEFAKGALSRISHRMQNRRAIDVV